MSAAPIIITGMHRSGTSLTASILRASGVHIGDRLYGAGRGNPRGHFEDLDLVELHAAILADAGLSEAGWTVERAIPWAREGHRAAARFLIERRATRNPWGWKDPRTVLFLEQWLSLLPEARFVFVTRPPWEVMDSLFRRGDFEFFWSPTLALRIWVHYNSLLLAFLERHGGQCLLVPMDQVIESPDGLIASVEAKFGLTLSRPDGRIADAGLVRRDRPSPTRLAAINRACPEAIDLVMRLNLDGAAAFPDFDERRPDPDAVFEEWSESARTVLQ